MKHVPSASLPAARRLVVLVLILLAPLPAGAELDARRQNDLKEIWSYVLTRRKGPFTINYCVCSDGRKAPVADDNLRIRAEPCAELFGTNKVFCSAFRTDKAQELGDKTGVYVANVFSNEVFDWERQAGRHDPITKGFILEKYLIETTPEAPLTRYRASGGISGAEYEAVYAPRYFALYRAMPGWTDFKNYFPQYELQRRFFLKAAGAAGVEAVRNRSLVLAGRHPSFKPIKDLIHNRLSAGLVPMIRDYAAKTPGAAASKAQFEALCADVLRLTRADAEDLRGFADLEPAGVKKALDVVLAVPPDDPAALLDALAPLITAARRAASDPAVSPEQAVRLVDCNVAAVAVMRAAAAALREKRPEMSARQALEVMGDLLAGVYGAGLVSQREYDEAEKTVRDALAAKDLTAGRLNEDLNRLNRTSEWAQNTVRGAFGDVLEAWTFLFPEAARITDDVIRSSPLMEFAALSAALREKVAASLDISHQVLGRTLTSGARALNPGLALGPLAVFGKPYSRENILALPTTNAELEPVAGIVTRDEGNAVSHVQLLARALGVPNAVFSGELYAALSALAGQRLFYAITPMGRIILKKTGDMDATDKLILAEYEKNAKRSGDGGVRGGTKLALDADRLNLEQTGVLELTEVGRADSGSICGPKAAFLGELARTFPGQAPPGLVIPFGVYAAHFQKAKVVPPEPPAPKPVQKGKPKAGKAPAAAPASAGEDSSLAAAAGSPLPEFVRQTYDTFFNVLLPDPKLGEAELAAWIKPRLEIIRHSLKSAPLDAAFLADLEGRMRAKGLLGAGVFVRSDTNVEDLPGFNGAGLNLTVFNLMTFEDVTRAILDVWASPFTYRSFSWRQAVINDPNLVYPSIVVLQSVPSEKSGVLITADVDDGDPSKMTVACSEGVGGAVDGSPAETLLWSPGETRLLAQFKAPTRRELVTSGQGGSRIVASTGKDHVLSEAELAQVTAAGERIAREFAPERSADGRPLPWDVEFGFAGGVLYLFQSRPFVGNSDLRNLPALAALDAGLAERAGQPFSLKESVRWP